MAEMMTTREVAHYLRIKERKVYDLVRTGRIPCTRITGKWLFPTRLIDLWVMEGAEGPAPERRQPPPIVAGSHDPLLDWVLQESECGLAMLACGSAAGLEHLADGSALAAGLHLLDADSKGYNVEAVRRTLDAADMAVVQWAWRQQGLVVAPGNPLGISRLSDLCADGVRVAHRQNGAGSELLFRHLLGEAGLAIEALSLTEDADKNEIELGLGILDGKADAGLAIEAVARRLKLGFVPLARERYDLAIGRRDYFEPPFQKLLAFARTVRFRRRAGDLGGYDVEGLGQVIYNGD